MRGIRKKNKPLLQANKKSCSGSKNFVSILLTKIGGKKLDFIDTRAIK